MNICGIELKSNYAVLVLVQDNKYIELKTKKIELDNDENQLCIRDFCNEILIYLKENLIDKVYIKKRSKKGNFAGGAVTFKMESLIQLNPHCEVDLISSQTINAFIKKNEISFPQKLNKYQEQAYLSALVNH